MTRLGAAREAVINRPIGLKQVINEARVGGSISKGVGVGRSRVRGETDDGPGLGGGRGAEHDFSHGPDGRARARPSLTPSFMSTDGSCVAAGLHCRSIDGSGFPHTHPCPLQVHDHPVHSIPSLQSHVFASSENITPFPPLFPLPREAKWKSCPDVWSSFSSFCLMQTFLFDE